MEYKIIKPDGLCPLPDKYEEVVAEVCTKWFKSDVQFVVRSNATTPDIIVTNSGQAWEIKNIRGNSKYTIRDNLRKAGQQSDHVIISLLKPTLMTSEQAERRIRHFLGTSKTSIQQVLLITKRKEVIDIPN